VSCQARLTVGSLGLMAAKIRSKQIRQALTRATVALIENQGGQKGAAAKAGVTQQTISSAKVHESGSWDLLCGLAQAFDRTVDELLQEYGGYPEGRVAFRAGTLVGWAEAIEAARKHETGIPEDAWALAGEVQLPFRPNAASSKLAAACAAVIVEASRGSGLREKLRPPVELPR
jgi:hypothetical protein